MRKLIKKVAICYLSLSSTIYFSFSFIQMEVNPANWAIAYRAFLVILSLGITITYTITLIENYENPDNTTPEPS